MNVTRLAVRRPVGVSMLLIAFLVVGLLSLQGMGLDLLPRMEFPIVAIVTIYPGADPQSVEEVVTKPLEGVLATVAGLQRMRSISMENAALILVEFGWGTPLDGAIRDIQNKVDQVAGFFPAQVYQPLLVQTDPSQFPLMVVGVSSRETASLIETTRRIEERVVPTLQQVRGVAALTVLGGTSEEVAVTYDSEALAELGITPTLLHQILTYQNTVVPAGTIEDGHRRLNVRAGRVIEGIDDLKEQPVALRTPTEPLPGMGLLSLAQALPVRLADVADVERQEVPRTGLTRVNGQDAIVLRILKQSGENTVAVARRVQDALAELEEDPTLGLQFHTITNQADLIDDSLANVSQSALWGAILAVGVLALFLRNWAALAVVATAVPLSILATVIILHATKTTLNLMSLGGIALSVGMLVDNAIVVVENITRHRELGKSNIDAAADGGSEIGPAVFAATVTTLVVFLPITTLQSLTGLLFRDMAMAVSAAIFASMIVALTVVPAAAARWGRSSSSKNEKVAPTPVPAWQEAAAARDEITAPLEPVENASALKQPRSFSLYEAYRKGLQRWIHRPWLTLVTTLGAVLLLVYLPTQMTGVFLPPMDGGIVYADLTFPPGTPSADARAIAGRYEEAIRAIPEVQTVALIVEDSSQLEASANIWSIAGSNKAQFTVVLHPRHLRSRSAAEVAESISAIPPGPGEHLSIEADRTAAALGDDYFPGLTVHVTGPDLDELRRVAQEVETALGQTASFRNVTSSLAPAQPELFYRITDRSFQGVFAGGEPLTAGQVGLALRHHVVGAVPTHITVDGVRLPVVLRPDQHEIESVEQLNQFRIPGVQLTASGSSSRPILDRIATVDEVAGPQAIEHLNRARLITLTAQLDGIGLGEARRIAQEVLDSLAIPSGYDVRIAGIHQVVDDSMHEMIRAVALAVLFVYIAMAVLFESWSQPILLMLSVPLAAAGALGVLKLSGHALSVPAMIGLVMLIGIAVNNGIIMIDCINRLRRSGVSSDDAVVEGSVQRLRPILMTALTTLFGLLPLAWATGAGSEFQVPMALAVCGGLIVSTFLTLFLLPGFLMILHRPHKRGRAHLRPVTGSLLVVGFIVGGVTLGGVADAQEPSAPSSRHFEALVTFLGTSQEKAHTWVGAGLLHEGVRTRAALRMTGSTQPLALQHGSLQASGFIQLEEGVLDASGRADVWLPPARGPDSSGHEISLGIGWLSPYTRSRVWVQRTQGPRGQNPWSGRMPIEFPLWQGGLQWEALSAVSGNSWTRSITVYKNPNTPPTWLLLGGPAFESPIARPFIETGLVLHQGRYTPLARLGSSFSLLPRGEIEVSLGPTLGPPLPGWPLVSVGYHGPLGSMQTTFRFEWSSPEAGFAHRTYLRLQPAQSPISILFTWTHSQDHHGSLGLLFHL